MAVSAVAGSLASAGSRAVAGLGGAVSHGNAGPFVHEFAAASAGHAAFLAVLRLGGSLLFLAWVHAVFMAASANTASIRCDACGGLPGVAIRGLRGRTWPFVGCKLASAAPTSHRAAKGRTRSLAVVTKWLSHRPHQRCARRRHDWSAARADRGRSHQSAQRGLGGDHRRSGRWQCVGAGGRACTAFGTAQPRWGVHGAGQPRILFSDGTMGTLLAELGHRGAAQSATRTAPRGSGGYRRVVRTRVHATPSARCASGAGPAPVDAARDCSGASAAGAACAAIAKPSSAAAGPASRRRSAAFRAHARRADLPAGAACALGSGSARWHHARAGADGARHTGNRLLGASHAPV